MRNYWQALTAYLFINLCVGSAYGVDTLNLAWDSGPRTIDPRYASDADSQYLGGLIYCSLISSSADGKTTNDLAESISWIDPKTLKIKLKKDIKFSDGSLVQPADVAATYSFFLQKDLKTPSPRSPAFSNLDSVAIDKDQSILFKLKQPDAPFVTNLVIGILPEKLAATKEPLPTFQVGCGPFKLSEQNPNEVVLDRNDHFNLGSKPNLSKVVIKVVKEESTRLAKLKKGELDLVQNLISRDELKNIGKSHPGLKVMKRPGLNTAYLGFNMKDPNLAKREVREAISLSINRDNMIKFALQGLATPANSMLLENDSFYDKSLPKVKFDPQRAQQLLDQAGLKGKPRLKLSLKTTTNTTRIIIAKSIAADLKKIGIDVSVEPVEWGRFKADVEAGRVQMWTLNWIGFKDPDILRFAFATESFPPNGANRGWYSNKDLDAVLSAGQKETDEGKRRDLYLKAQKIIDTEFPYAFLWHEEIFAVMKNQVDGFELYADGSYHSLRNTKLK